MPRIRKRLPSPAVLGVLRSGFRHPRQICSLQRPLSGAALNALLLSLDREGLVHIDWVAARGGGGVRPAGTVIGDLTDRGDEVYQRGWM